MPHVSNEDILKQLQVIHQSDIDNAVNQARIIGQLESIDNTLSSLCKEVNKHDETLYGNGKEGITTTIRLLSQAYDRLSKWFWLILAGFAGLILQAVWQLITGANP